MFAPHHYLTADLSPQARCWVATWDGEMIGFMSVLAMPGKMKHAWREHRTVVMPDYQGMGIGAMLGECLGEMHLQEGKRLYSRTVHPRLARYRHASPVWRETATSQKQSRLELERFNNHLDRPAYSFEYVGKGTHDLPTGTG